MKSATNLPIAIVLVSLLLDLAGEFVKNCMLSGVQHQVQVKKAHAKAYCSVGQHKTSNLVAIGEELREQACESWKSISGTQMGNI